MGKTTKFFSTSELAKMYNLHPNTIRLYEHLGYISLAQRKDNNYRIFTELHVLQVKICRCIYGYPFFNKRIRDAGNKIMWASGKQQWDKGEYYTREYIELIKHEIKIANNTANILKVWAIKKCNNQNLLDGNFFSRRQIAAFFGVTVETIRNWERNYLIYSDNTGQFGEKLYSQSMFKRIQVIYMLRQAGYSIAAIHSSLLMLNTGNPEMIIIALNTPSIENDIISVGDRWIYELKKLYNAAQNIPILFEQVSILED
ncbi:MerR family transcriptional regulator [Maledivibacter halophilus]|uniref:Predicted transcriptional regulators n=1 Tax=Maledivibacter halophilus TaxID=36842 RepID=A0A1T5LDN3_9FIRM|nr:MerR family transcriptional regulator [Maledivibacter halophilus]SKC73518.1 Predicted transcriptional regulators [Maledivibacter halophilus]